MKRRDLFYSTIQTDSWAPALCHRPQVGTPNRESIRFPCSDPRPHAACHSSELPSPVNLRQQILLPTSPRRGERRGGGEGNVSSQGSETEAAGMTPAPGGRRGRTKRGSPLLELGRRSLRPPTRARLPEAGRGGARPPSHGWVGTEGDLRQALRERGGRPGPGHLPASSPR